MRTDGLAWIRANVPIVQVAGALGLDVSGNAARCWRRANHAHGDKNPSLGFTSQNRFKCFVCDRRPLSNIDLAMRVLGFDLRAALNWFRNHFDIPAEAQPRQHDPDAWKRVTLESLVQCGIWAGLSESQRSILVALWISREPESGLVHLSYGRILRLSGLSSRKTITAAIACFERMHLLKVQRADRRMSVYQFIEHDEFRERQRESLGLLNSKELVPLEGTSSANELSNLVPSEGTRSENDKLVPSEGTGSLGPLHTGLSSPRGNQFGKSSDSEEQVLRLAGRGFLVFPCKSREKTPMIANWQRLATADAGKIARWFERFPECNWGIRTGPASKLLVLDVDGEAGLNSLHRLIAEHGDDPQPDTLSVKTSRGWQMYFTHPVGARIPNSTGTIGPGLDIRGAGGYVIAPPSVHPDGPVYRWLGEDGENKPVTLPPKWLLAAIEADVSFPADTRRAEVRECELSENASADN